MKKIKMFAFFVVLMLFSTNVNAASVTIGRSATTITKGSRVTFYVNVNNAASWQLSGSGYGATSGCSLSDDDRTGFFQSGENGSKTLYVTCTSTDIGQIGFSVTGTIAYMENGKQVKMPVSTGTQVSVVKPRDPDSNNYLSSLGVEGYELSPEFNKDTLEYSVTVPASVSTVKVVASKDSQYASDPVGTGDIEVSEGLNKLKVTVTSETNVLREYTLNVTVKDENPIKVNVNSNDYTIVKNAKNLTKPDNFEATTIKINDIEVPAFKNETLNIILVGVKDEAGNIYLSIYNESKKEYSLFNSNKSAVLNLYIMNIKDEKEGFHKDTIKVNGNTYEGLVSDVDNSVILVYAKNLNDGYDNYYLYNENNNTFTIYNDSITKSLKEELDRYKQVLMYGAGVVGFLLLLVIILIFRRPKRKVVYKGSLEETKEEDKKESLEDAEEKQEEVVEEKKLSKKELKALRKEEKRKKKQARKEKHEVEEEALEEVKEETKEEDKKEVVEEVKENKELSRTEAIRKVKDAEKIVDNFDNKSKKSSRREEDEEEFASLDKTRDIKLRKVKEKLEETPKNAKIEDRDEVGEEDEMFDLLTDGKRNKKRK